MRRSSLLTLLVGVLLGSGAAAEENGLGARAGGEPALGAVLAKPGKPAVARGSKFFGFSEKFNRYYTDPGWKPSKTIYVSPDGGGNGSSHGSPTSVQEAIDSAGPGTLVHFVQGKYDACYEFSKQNSGTYDKPIVLYGERKPDKSIGVSMQCCTTERQACFNFEATDYVALDGMELVGGGYGVRAVGADYPASKHARGIAVLNSHGHDQDRDPFFSGQVDWAVWERNEAHGAGEGDGHGIYLSNGGDWNVVRFNETYSNSSSDFQINADPNSTCADVGIPFDDPRCDDYAGTGEGGQGASDYFLVDANYFHDSDGPGPNFTSVRRSMVRNNIFGPQALHNVSFWQETDNPKLGSSENKVFHNLIVTTDRHGLQFINDSDRNEFVNNVLLGIQINGGKVTANPDATLMEVDNSVGDNVYRANLYVSGQVFGRKPNAQEFTQKKFSASWYKKFPVQVKHNPNDFTPTKKAPFLSKGKLLPEARTDRNGTVRSGKVDLGPIELR